MVLFHGRWFVKFISASPLSRPQNASAFAGVWRPKVMVRKRNYRGYKGYAEWFFEQRKPSRETKTKMVNRADQACTGYSGFAQGFGSWPTCRWRCEMESQASAYFSLA
jgi:hypothetical protein